LNNPLGSILEFGAIFGAGAGGVAEVISISPANTFLKNSHSSSLTLLGSSFALYTSRNCPISSIRC
jgi:hypothetical protein